MKIESLLFRQSIDASSMVDFEENLGGFLASDCEVIGDDARGYIVLEKRHLVERKENIKIEIYSNEHSPPHFHVKGREMNASFSIKNCELIDGSVSSKDYKKIYHWFIYAKPKLVEIWNKTRPINCSVGKIVDI